MSTPGRTRGSHPISPITSGRSSPQRRSTGSGPENIERYQVELADRPMLKKTEPRIQLLDQPAPEQLLTATYPDDALGRIEPML
ncbi:MAG TPA: hypothetical protein VG388_00875, partial [Solirubrobacteraceae bacterium]|nr:hypothetical protein [Solirubrobacteraceae bacterium]